MRSRWVGSRTPLAAFAAAGLLLAAGCSGTTTGPKSPDHAAAAPAPRVPAASATPHSYAIGELTETFVDRNRPTPAHGAYPEQPARTLRTTILYPAAGNASAATPAPGATPAGAGKPFPLIVFAHGYAADPQSYTTLLAHLASAGFVVAAPRFPLSSAGTPGGPIASDVINQPGDESFVLTSVLKLAAGTTGVLAGLIDPQEIGAAGHSNGAITTLGLVANTCCHDKRIKAAAELAGDPEAFPHGHYDYALAPPLLIVHGTDDSLIPYTNDVGVFNSARAPKYLLTINGGDHASAAAMIARPSDASVLRTLTDFFDAYLKGDRGALSRLPHEGQAGVTTIHADPQPGTPMTIPTPPAPELHLQASVEPDQNLTNGQLVTVRWSGYTPGKVVSVLQCSAADADLTNSAACDFSSAKLLQPDPTGEGSLQLKITVGAVGNSFCDAAHQGCFIVVNNASGTALSDNVKVPITVTR